MQNPSDVTPLMLAQLGKTTVGDIVELTREFSRLLTHFSSGSFRAMRHDTIENRQRRLQLKEKTLHKKETILQRFRVLFIIHSKLEEGHSMDKVSFLLS